MIIETIIYIALIIGLLFVCDNRYSRKYYVPFKAACSASFLVLALLHKNANQEISLLLLPLLACFIGDILMGLYNTYAKKKFIVTGIGVFLLGHIGFIYYLCSKSANTSILVFIIPILVVCIMYIIVRLSKLHMGRLIIAALFYCYFVSTMCIKSIECGIKLPTLAASLCMVAGILFFLSDFSIMFLYFYHFKNRTHKKFVHYFNLLTYYIAILLFIYSAK